MTKKQIEQLKNWEKETQNLTDYFMMKYFTEYEPDWYWISGEIGGTLFVNDHFYNLDRLVEAIRYNATYKQLMDFEELEKECFSKGAEMKTNFRNFIKYDKKTRI